MQDEQKGGLPQSPADALSRAYQGHARVMARRAEKRRVAEHGAVKEPAAILEAWRRTLESQRES